MPEKSVQAASRTSKGLTSSDCIDGGTLPAAWVPKDRSWPILAASLDSEDVCEGNALRVTQSSDGQASRLILCSTFYEALSLDVSNKPKQIQGGEPEGPDDPRFINMLGENDFAAGLLMYAIMFLWRPNRCKPVPV